jgi:diadenosine tetraphosphate (Ap4A) HIT family hydrolase
MGGDGFTLHPQLAADTVEVDRWPLSRVLLSNDSTYPWLILVPQLPDLRDLHDVPAVRHGALMAEIDRASRALQTLFGADKINVAALGNQVPQLHVHVIARHTGDPAWPKPIWGAVPPRPYDDAALAERLDALRTAFGDPV